MCDLRKLARVILISLGVYILLYAGYTVIMSMPFWVFSEFRDYGLMVLIWFILLIAFYVLMIFLLFKKADFWAERIAGSGEQREEPSNINWIPVAFRLVAVFAGICILYWTIPNIIWSIRAYISARIKDIVFDSDFVSIQRWIGWIIELALSVYLICGAPHFVRWQVKKTMEQIKVSSETGLQQKG